MNGNETFELNGKSTGFCYFDFWKFHYSNIFDLQDKIAEFIVSKALGINEAFNDKYWTLWDISYREKRIEVKELHIFILLIKMARYLNNEYLELPKQTELMIRKLQEIAIFVGKMIYMFFALIRVNAQKAHIH